MGLVCYFINLKGLIIIIIKLSPQVTDIDKIRYDIEHQKITVTMNNQTDTFDFTNFPDGELQLWTEDGESLLDTNLNAIPIISAYKKNDTLNIELIFSIDAGERDERLLFPKPMTLDEYNVLMDELAERDKPEDDELDGEEEPEDDEHKAENIDIEEVDF